MHIVLSELLQPSRDGNDDIPKEADVDSEPTSQDANSITSDEQKSLVGRAIAYVTPSWIRGKDMRSQEEPQTAEEVSGANDLPPQVS